MEMGTTWRNIGNSLSSAALSGVKRVWNIPHGQEVDFVSQQCQCHELQGVQKKLEVRPLIFSLAREMGVIVREGNGFNFLSFFFFKKIYFDFKKKKFLL